MAILNSCCCWNNVRTGSIACGVYTLLLSLVSGGLVGYNLSKLSETEEQIGHQAQLQIIRGWFASIMVIFFTLLVCSAFLIVGIHRDNRFLLLPWVMTLIAVIAVDTAVLIYQCINFGIFTLNIIQMVIWLGLSLLNVYCILCVISQYQELKAGRGRLQDVQRSRATVVYHPAIQQVHITQGPILMTYPPPECMAHHQQQMTTPAVKATVMMSPPEYSVVAGPGTVDTAASGCQEQGPEETLLPGGKKQSPPPPYCP